MYESKNGEQFEIETLKVALGRQCLDNYIFSRNKDVMGKLNKETLKLSKNIQNNYYQLIWSLSKLHVH